jgi:hypothetical protein
MMQAGRSPFKMTIALKTALSLPYSFENDQMSGWMLTNT